MRIKVLLVALVLAAAGAGYYLFFGGPAFAADALALGAKAPDLVFKTPDGKDVKLAEFRLGTDGKPVPVVITFWSYKCPTGKGSMGRFAELAKACADRGARFIGVCSYGESAGEVAEYAKKNGIAYPLVMDESTKMAALFGAKTVTSTFVLDADLKLVYRGSLGKDDDRLPEAALDAVKAGKPVAKAETRAFG